MEVKLVDRAESDFDFWQNSGNEKIKSKILELLKNISETPETGIGKPEKLKFHLTGFWSRRINREHRIVYSIDYQINTIFIHS